MKQLTHVQQNQSQTTINSDTKADPFLEWKYQANELTGELELESIQLSDKSEPTIVNLNNALKNASGSSDSKIGERILLKVARGLSAETHDCRINEASALLSALQPRNETEALLLGQFLALNDSGVKCLRLANLPNQGFHHMERLFGLANKLLNTSQHTMQTILKLRSSGQTSTQVIHMHNEGQAIVAQNLSPSYSRDIL